MKGVGKAYDRNNNPGMIADVIGDVYGEEDEYGDEEGAGFKRENEGNYDFMWTTIVTQQKKAFHILQFMQNIILVKNLIII